MPQIETDTKEQEHNRKPSADGDSSKFIAGRLIASACILWAVLSIIGFQNKLPMLGLIPVFGLYPWDIGSGHSGHLPQGLILWGILFGFVYLGLAFTAFRYRSIAAGIAFAALFLLSTIVLFVRAVEGLSVLH